MGTTLSPESQFEPFYPPLPNPPIVYVGGQRCVVERIPISDLDAWALEHKLQRIGTAWMGNPGWRPTASGKMRFSGLGPVTIYWPENTMGPDAPPKGASKR